MDSPISSTQLSGQITEVDVQPVVVLTEVDVRLYKEKKLHRLATLNYIRLPQSQWKQKFVKERGRLMKRVMTFRN